MYKMKVSVLGAFWLVLCFAQIITSQAGTDASGDVPESQAKDPFNEPMNEKNNGQDVDAKKYEDGDEKQHTGGEDEDEKQHTEDENEESETEKSDKESSEEEEPSNKRSHPQVCPPGWCSPWEMTGGSSSSNSGCEEFNGGECGGGDYNGGCCGEVGRCCGGHMGCGCSDYGSSCGGYGGCGGGYGCGCGGGCGCRYHGGFGGRCGFRGRYPHISNDGHVQHVYMRDGRMRRHIPSPLLMRRNMWR